MNELEIIIINDKSYVRLVEYQKLKELIEKMKLCRNCDKLDILRHF